jgi:hypothetical protein
MSTAHAAGFDPNQVTFDEGLKRIQAAVRKVGLHENRVLTSQDRQVVDAQSLLMVTNVPGGFTKWQLPVYLDKPSQMFVTLAAPNAEVPEHSHNEGAGIRFIAGGSIIYNGKELTAGDWMYIPAGARYSFKVGPLGATMCYCYCCCCAGRADLAQDVINPPTIPGA